jgi:pyruvate formate lyase activating enzyme
MLIMDFKHYDDAVCARVTGIGNSQIKLNIIDAFSNHKNVLIRIPVIHCINDSEQDIRNFAIFFKQYQPGNASFEFLPYHEYGKSKWFQCGMPYLMENAHVGQETIALFESVFRDYGLRVIHT